MKRFFALALVLALTLVMATGCRSRNDRTPTTKATMPNAGEMIPGPEDTISETNGANQPETTRDTIGADEGENNASTSTVPSENSRVRPRSNILPSK